MPMSFQMYLRSTNYSVGSAADSLIARSGFDPHSGRGVVSLSKTLLI